MRDVAETTDPVSEMVLFLENLREVAGSGTSTASVIAQRLMVDTNSPEMFEVLAAINNRLASLTKFVESVDDRFATRRTRPLVLAALQAIRGGLGPLSLGGQWLQVRENSLSENNLAALATFAPIAASHRPIRKISAEELATSEEKLGELIGEIRESEELPSWAKPVLVEAIERLQFMITRLLYFGHEAIVNELVLLGARSRALNTRLMREQGADHRDGLKILFKTAKVVAIVGELFCLPDQVSSAWHSYLSAPIVHQTIEPTMKALPSPEQSQKQAQDDNASEI